jgi:hypothetical protein
MLERVWWCEVAEPRATLCVVYDAFLLNIEKSRIYESLHGF